MPNNDFPDYRYKMTIYAGGKSFSSVREVTNKRVRTILDSSGETVKSRLEGEAVILDLPNRSVPVFALLSSNRRPDYAKGIAGAALKPVRDEGGDLNGYAKWMQHMVAVKGTRDLPQYRSPHPPEKGIQSLWPVFVTFTDPSDPSTVFEVSPESVGVSRITIEIADDNVTQGIAQRLPWLDRYRDEGRRLNGNQSIAISTNDLADNLGPGSFKVGGYD